MVCKKVTKTSKAEVDNRECNGTFTVCFGVIALAVLIGYTLWARLWVPATVIAITAGLAIRIGFLYMSHKHNNGQDGS